MEGTKKDVEYWINQFDGLRKTININKWNRYMYIPQKSGYVTHAC